MVYTKVLYSKEYFQATDQLSEHQIKHQLLHKSVQLFSFKAKFAAIRFLCLKIAFPACLYI